LLETIKKLGNASKAACWAEWGEVGARLARGFQLSNGFKQTFFVVKNSRII